MFAVDYNEERLRANQLPITFRLTGATAIDNPSLSAAFEKRRAAFAADSQLFPTRGKVVRGFHGTALCVDASVASSVFFAGTAPRNLLKIAETGLLRVGHPLNPSKPTDEGWFGVPDKGVSVSQYVDYVLQYSNGLAALLPDEEVSQHPFVGAGEVILAVLLRRCAF